jgi:K+-sensing histidine kinase KdpD
MTTLQKKILVLLEDGVIQEESVLYSIELARRLELPIALLMLVSDESNISEAEEVLVKELMEPIVQAQVEVSKEVCSGDKATELLKYLATNSNLTTIVWGSDRRMVGKLGVGKPHHWLNRMKGLLPCSIVSPISKKGTINKNPKEG